MDVGCSARFPRGVHLIFELFLEFTADHSAHTAQVVWPKYTSHGQFLEHECESGFGCRQQKWVSSGVYGGTVIISVHWLKSSRFGRDTRFSLIKFPVVLFANSGTSSSLKHCRLFFAQVATEATFTIVRKSALWYLFGVELWPLLRSVQSGELELQLLLCSSGFGLGKMITAEYAEEARFFLQRVISWIASIAAMFYTAKESDDLPNGDVHPENAFSLSSNRARVARWEAPTYSDDTDGCWAPLSAGLWVRSSEEKFLS